MNCSSGKESFGTQKQANEWVAKWNKTKADGETKHKLHSSYLCPECNTWHVSKCKNRTSRYLEEIKLYRDELAIIKSAIDNQLIYIKKIISKFE